VSLLADADRVVDDEADVAAPQGQERRLGALAVHGADRLGDGHRVRVERTGRRLELRLAPAECRVGGRAREVECSEKRLLRPARSCAALVPEDIAIGDAIAPCPVYWAIDCVHPVSITTLAPP
jgi:hypothetical protein